MTACFVKKGKKSVLTAADQDWFVQGGQLYLTFPFSEDSLNDPKAIGENTSNPWFFLSKMHRETCWSMLID